MAGEMNAIGLGTSLSGRANEYVPLIGERMKLDALGRQKKEKDQFIDIDKDLKDENRDRLPLYSQQAIQVHKDLIGDYLGYKQKGLSDNQAHTMVSRDIYKYQQRLNDINNSNDAAQTYLKSNSGTNLTGDKAKFQNVVMNRDATPEDFKALHNPDFGISAGDNYNLAYSPKAYEGTNDIIKKFTDGNFDLINYKKGAVITGEDGNPYQKVSFPFVANKKAIDMAKNEILSGNNGGNLASFKYDVLPNLSDQYKSLPEYKNFSNSDPNIRIPAQNQLVGKVVANSMHKPDQESTLPFKQENQTDKDRQWKVEGNTYHDGNNIWTYNNIGGRETIIPAKKNGDSKPLDFKIYDASGKNVAQTISAKNAYLVKDKGDENPRIFATVSEKESVPIDPEKPKEKKHIVETIKTIPIPFNDHNADQIRERYGNKDFYSVKQAITGNLGTGKENNVGTFQDKFVKSTKQSSGASKELHGIFPPDESDSRPAKQSSGETQEFNVDGVKYNIPKDKVAAFKKAKGL